MLHRPKFRALFSFLFIASFAVCLWLGQVSVTEWSRGAIAQEISQESGVGSQESASGLVQQGVERYRAGDVLGAIAPWSEALEAYRASDNLDYQGIVLENLARAYRQLGDATAALPYWEEAVSVYQQLGDIEKAGRMLTEQAQTYTSLGQYRQAIALLCGNEGGSEEVCLDESAVGIAQRIGDRPGEAAALGSVGEIYRLQGVYEPAARVLTESLAIAQDLDNPLYIAAATNSLGSVYAQQTRISDRRAEDALDRGDLGDAEELEADALEENQRALGYFQQSLDAATRQGDRQGQVRAMLNLIPAYHRAEDLAATQAIHARAIALLPQVSASRDKAYSMIDLANLLPLTRNLTAVRGSLSGANCLTSDLRAEAETLLVQAIATAQQIQDNRAQSFAAGKLGHLYECEGDDEKALTFTRDAELAADQDFQSRDSLYLWQWQTGRILNDQGKVAEAIAAYEEAIATLEKIRSDILTADRDIQFDFRDAVEPVYRELTELRLNQAPSSKIMSPVDEQDTVANIRSALTAIDSLKLAELQNYFGDECIILASIDPTDPRLATDSRDDQAGVLSTFILGDRTAIILTLPNGQQQLEWLETSRDDLNQQLNQFRIGLEESLYSLEDYNPAQAQALYDQLIRPFAASLEDASVETLVFVQDGMFRSVPMAALHDGEQYLIEQYAIATTPSLSLTSLTPAPRRRNLRALALGLSQATVVNGQSFAALTAVGDEIDSIQEQLPGSQQLLNAEFTLERLRQELQASDYSIVHMATHGEFGAEPEDTFLITGDEQKLTIGELESAIRNTGGTRQIDLLTLTACKTALGDNRSALGLAGVAVQAGARSAIASLWAINDASTAQIMADFYQSLSQPDFTTAQALRSAQQKAIESGDRLSRPAFWAPFILIGDWR
ncbi:MAG: CHAT domain-containing protein [Elainellaceae cyanobacterium]